MKEAYFKLKEYIRKHKLQPLVDVFLFGVITVFFHWLWWHGGLKHFLLDHLYFSELEQFMAHQVFVPSAWIVDHIIGYPLKTMHNTLIFPKNAYVTVAGSCSGLKQFYQWTILMILFPGPWKKKLWYIPLGILVLHIVNIFRIVILSVVVVNWPRNWDFIHESIMRPFFYVVIFAMWVLWVERIRGDKKTDV